MQACASHILQYPGTEVAVLQSAISKNLVLPSAVHKLSATYPIARFYRAFDFVISAAGYNSFHELINFQIPAAFFPVRKPTDNQAARARYAEDSGVAVEVGLDTSRAVEVLISSKEREKMRRKAGERRFDNGAGEAAEMIAQLAAAPEAAPAARPHRGRGKPQPVSGRRRCLAGPPPQPQGGHRQTAVRHPRHRARHCRKDHRDARSTWGPRLTQGARATERHWPCHDGDAAGAIATLKPNDRV